MSIRSKATVLDATERLLEQMPLHELTVQDILERAGVSRRTFYTHFGSKYAVVAELLAGTLEEVMLAAEPCLTQRGGAARQSMRQTLECAAATWARHPAVMSSAVEYWHVVPELHSLWMACIDRFVEGLAAAIESDRAALAAPPGFEATRLASAFVWAGERMFYVTARGDDPRNRTMADAVDALNAMWLGSVYAVNEPHDTDHGMSA